MHATAFDYEINQRVNNALWEGAMTRKLIIGTNALESVGECFRQIFGDAMAVVVADANTYKAAGRRVQQQLAASPLESGQAKAKGLLDPFLFEDANLYAEYSHVERLRQFLAANNAVAVAVGAGTINDIVKLSSGMLSRPYMSVATAASMDGYASFGASVTHNGYKQTLPCAAPLVVVVDLDVLAAAPPRLNAAGYADLLAKLPAGADWQVADALGVEKIDQHAWSLVQDGLRYWLSDPAAVRRGDRRALAGLIEGLVMTGLGMQYTGTTRPASGAEHQFSHLWDMQHHSSPSQSPFGDRSGEGGDASPMHGEKVGIGSIASAAIYERVLRQDPEAINLDIDVIRRRWPTWEAVETVTRRDSSDPLLADQIVEQQRAKYVDADKLLDRLTQLKSCWSLLRERLQEQLLPAGQIRSMLAAVGAPDRPEAIGISRQRLQDSHALAQRIRSRYTVLDLVFEAGWWDACVESLFKPGGIWQ